MIAIKKEKYYTIEEYKKLAAESEEKLEYHDGQIYAMAGATSNHNLIAGNVHTLLNNAVWEKDCSVYTSDQAIRIPKYNRYVYPDASMLCEDGKFEDENEIYLLNPSLLIEVVSESSVNRDRDEKFLYYKSLPSMKEYLLIYAFEPFALSYYREDKSLWRISSGVGLKDSIKIHSLDIKLKMKDLYRRTKNLQQPFTTKMP